jgi:threonyl-tRNA synthetase
VALQPAQESQDGRADRHNEYAERVAVELREAGVRVASDLRSESVGKKIRDAELGRYPYMLVVGDREQDSGAVAVRAHEEGELGAMPIAEFAERVRGESERG